jgi:hypothetical protein
MNKQEIIMAIRQMSGVELIELNNRYCIEFGYIDNEIFVNDEEFFNTFYDGKPMEVARATFYGDYNFSHEFVVFNGYGNLDSFNHMDVSKLVDSVDVMAESIEESFDAFEDLF